MSEEENGAAVKDFALTKGLLVALLAGVMSSWLLGLDGTPYQGSCWQVVDGLYAGLPVIFLVTLGGFMTMKPYACSRIYDTVLSVELCQRKGMG